MAAHCHRRHKGVAHELSHFAHVKAIRFDIAAHRVCIGQCRRSPQQRRARSRGTSSSEIEVAQILVHLAFRISVGGVCFCHLPRNMKSPNTSVTCRASHALSKLLLGAVAQNLVLRDEKEDEDNMYTALVSKAAPGREDARHPKCGPSSGNSTQSVHRHAEIHAGGSRHAHRSSAMRVDLRTVRQKMHVRQLMSRRGGHPLRVRVKRWFC